MKLASVDQKGESLDLIRNKLAQYRTTHPNSKGRRYPQGMKVMIRQAIREGASIKDLQRLTGVSTSALRRWAISNETASHIDQLKKESKNQAVSPRRLEVVGNLPRMGAAVTVRLPSGVCLELANVELLNGNLLSLLAGLEVPNATTC